MAESASPAAPSEAPVTIADVSAAAERIRNLAERTPLLENGWLNEATGGRVLIKPECLQRTGSFKIRGASNRLARLSESERAAGVVAFSSGNHAQGVAAAAKRLGISATIVMPEDAPRLKLANTRAFGARVVTYDRQAESREELARRIAEETGAVLVPSYDDPDIIAGQGTVGLEIAAQAGEIGALPELALFPVGGGGLISGSAIALKAAFPEIAVIGVEPQGFDDTARSLAAGSRVSNAPGAQTICDALLPSMPGRLTFAAMRQAGVRGLAVSDSEVAHAMRFAFERLKLVVEPGGVVALAALLAGKLDVEGRTAAITLSGGNVDAERFCELTGPASP